MLIVYVFQSTQNKLCFLDNVKKAINCIYVICHDQVMLSPARVRCRLPFAPNAKKIVFGPKNFQVAEKTPKNNINGR